jgi:SIR2-like domain
MPGTVIVIGAGASVSEALHHRPKQRKEHPPLDATLFRRVKKYNRHSTLFRRVQSQASNLNVRDLARDDPPIGLENYLGRLYFNVQHNPGLVPTSAYFDMIDLYAWEVIQTTDWMMGRSGPIMSVLQKELSAGRSAAVVTFNIDLLIENALDELRSARPGASWSLRNAYGFGTPLSIAQRTDDPTYFNFDNSPVDIPLYKLHGSVNWLFRHRDYYPPSDLVSQPRKIWQSLNKSQTIGRQRVRTGTAGRGTWYAFPLIVPPIYEKHAFIRMHLQAIWDHAQAALEEAERVIFWGYSFPAADTHARHFFEGLADANPALRNPIIVNPDPNAGAAMWSLLRAESVTQYGDVTSYLAS